MTKCQTEVVNLTKNQKVGVNIYLPEFIKTKPRHKNVLWINALKAGMMRS